MAINVRFQKSPRIIVSQTISKTFLTRKMNCHGTLNENLKILYATLK